MLVQKQYQTGAAVEHEVTRSLADTHNRMEPEFLRLPKPATLCPYSGLTRSSMNNLVLPGPWNNFSPPVRSVVLRQRGNVRGVRLIVYRSLMDFLHALPSQGGDSQ